MAQERVASFEGGTIEFFVAYNSGNMRVTSFDCVNNTTESCYGEIIDPATLAVYGQTFGAGTTSRNVPNNALTIRFVASTEPDFGPTLEVWNSATGQWQLLPTRFRFPA